MNNATPRAGALVAKLFEGLLPEGLLALVQGGGDVGAALVAASPDVVIFTGSVSTGRKIAEAAARGLVPVSLELGGKDAAIVLEERGGRLPDRPVQDDDCVVFAEEGLHFGEQRLVAGTRLVEKGRAIGWIAADGCLVDSGHLLPALGSEVHAGLPGRRFRLKARRGDGPCLLLVKRLRVLDNVI